MTEAEALVASAAIEGPVAALIVWLAGWPSRGALHVGLAAAVATAVTHPQLWSAAIWAYSRYPYRPTAALLEALVIFIEGILIAWMAALTWRHALVVSLAANLASFVVGAVIA